MVSDSEKEDFLDAIKKHGFQENDFELTEQRNPTSGIEYAITGTVTVRCKSNKIVKIYKAGHGTSWPTQFHDDLALRVFGNPRK